MIKLTDNLGAVYILPENIAQINSTKEFGTMIILKNDRQLWLIKETPEQVYELMKKYYESLP